MSKLRQPCIQTRRDAWVEINLANIEHNFLTLKNYCNKNVGLIAIVKADAYGHGATMVAQQLSALGISGFGVASIDEGIELRISGTNLPILVLGSVPSWSFVSAVENDIELAIFTEEHIKLAIQAYEHCQTPVKVWIKIDTGMNRIGLSYKEAPEFLAKLLNRKEIHVCGMFSHLACAEKPDITEKQIQKFNFVKEQFPNLKAHILNTAGLMSYNKWQYDYMRAGIGLYGLLPDVGENVVPPKLKPVMALKGRIAHLKTIDKNEGISYSYTYKTDKLSKIATIPIGYADGVPRSLSNKIYGLINGKKVPQIGNITMDQMMFDVTNISNVAIGDVITLLGEDEKEIISIDEWANIINTINYELTCRLKVRLPRVYTR